MGNTIQLQKLYFTLSDKGDSTDHLPLLGWGMIIEKGAEFS